MSHYLKTTMDCIFGEKNFRNEIIWKRRQDVQNSGSKTMGAAHDTILWYGNSNKALYYKQFTPYSEEYLKTHYKHSDSRGKYRMLPCSKEGYGHARYDFRGVVRAWVYCPENMQEMYDDDLLVQLTDGGPYYYKKYLADAEGVPVQDIWLDLPPARGKKEYKGWPTQKPLALINRILKASSKEGDIVLDPFCGCATTCVAAEHLGRKWIGIDLSEKAYDLVKERLVEAAVDKNDILKYKNEIHLKSTPPKRTDIGEVDHEAGKFVYVISNRHFPGEYKVGIAKDPKARLNQYQTSDPDRAYKIEFTRRHIDFRKLEAYIHDKFNNKREWVTGDLKEIITAIKTY